VRLRRGLTKLRQRTTDRSGSFDVTSGPQGPAGFQRQDGNGRRLLGKGRRVRSVIPAWRGQRTATNQNGRRPSWTAWGTLSLTGAGAVHRKRNICFLGFLAPVTGHWRRPRPCLNVAVHSQFRTDGPTFNNSGNRTYSGRRSPQSWLALGPRSSDHKESARLEYRPMALLPRRTSMRQIRLAGTVLQRAESTGCRAGADQVDARRRW